MLGERTIVVVLKVVLVIALLTPVMWGVFAGLGWLFDLLLPAAGR